MFFSFDGLDGVGKTTQINLFCEWLRMRGHDVLCCVDPGSTPLGERLRETLLRRDVTIGMHSEMLLFMAARAQLVEEVISPAIARGQVVVSDRYLLANLVYQGYAGGLDVESLRQIGAIATGGIYPELTFILDMPPWAAGNRIDRHFDHMESRGASYQSRLREGFLAEAARDPQRIAVIDATRPIDEVQSEVRRHAERALK
jgi:dTMP kinase